MQVAIIGGGASGFFAALSVKEHHPSAVVTIFEKSPKVLSKVKVSGGGRCNVTNAQSNPSAFIKGYPRGAAFLKGAFKEFGNQRTIAWFKQRGVLLVAEEDGRMFPFSNNSQTIIDCFMHACSKNKIEIKTQIGLKTMKILPSQNILLVFDNQQEIEFDKVIITIGGGQKITHYGALEHIPCALIEPVPSLFTFNIPNSPLQPLMGLSAPKARVRLVGTSLATEGPVLITHWGLSGPAVLKLSAFAARELHHRNYAYHIAVNWIGIQNTQEIQHLLAEYIRIYPKKQLKNGHPFTVPSRLWEYLLQKADLDPTKLWQDVGKKALNKLLEVLSNDLYSVHGKTTFKEEFVTCGGVSLSEIHPKTLAHIHHKNIYFAGEVLDVDGITGGYNFQAAWTTGYLAGKLLEI